MCVGVTVWFGWGSVVSLCRLKHPTIKMMQGPINIIDVYFTNQKAYQHWVFRKNVVKLFT